MTTRIAVFGTGDSSGEEDVPQPIKDAARGDCQPVYEDVPGVVFPGDQEARQVAGQAYVRAGERLADQYGALYINTMGDYGMHELRARVDTPVIGSGEAALRTALSLGASVSIVTIWPPMLRFLYEHVIADTGAEKAVRSIHHLSTDEEIGTMGQGDDFYSEMRACGTTSMNQIRATCETALKEDSAEVIILGCTCMYPTGPILKGEGLPVIEPMVNGYRYAELLALA